MPRITTHPALMLLRAAALVALAFCTALAIEYYGVGATFCDSEGGCAAVHESAIGQLIGDYLPIFGLLAFASLFIVSLVPGRSAHRLAVYGAIAGGIGGVVFLAIQGAVIGAWCKLCVGVDLSAVVAAGAAVWLLRVKPPEDRLGHGVVSPAWFFFWPLVLGPALWVVTFPDPDVPAAIRELWDPAADVTIVEMADFECPYCRAMHPVLSEAIERADAEVHLARIIYPLGFHPHARNSARAYFCAVEQGQGDAMADALFEAEDISEAGNRESAAQLGLDLDAYDACVVAEATEARVEEDLARGDRAGMEGLPSVYIGEQTFRGFLPGSPPDPFIDAIEAAAAGEGKRVILWPSATIGLFAVVSLVVGVRRRRRQQERAKEPEAEPEDRPVKKRRPKKPRRKS